MATTGTADNIVIDTTSLFTGFDNAYTRQLLGTSNVSNLCEFVVHVKFSYIMSVDNATSHRCYVSSRDALTMNTTNSTANIDLGYQFLGGAGGGGAGGAR